MDNFNIEIVHKDANTVGVHCFHLGKKIGLQFSFTDSEDYCTKFGLACAAILRKINNIPGSELLAIEVPDDMSDIEAAKKLHQLAPPEGVIITGFNHEIKPIGGK